MKNLIINLTVVMIRSICILCICVNILLAEDLRSQNLDKTNITLDLTNVTLKEALNEIERKTEFSFTYFNTALTFAKNHYVTLNAENISVGNVLKSIAKKTGASFQLKRASIAVKAPQKLSQSIPEKKELPEKVIRGKVTDENGDPLPGANILVKGTTIGVVSDGDGNYVISMDDNVTTLVVSFIGYSTQEVDIAGRSVIDIVLKADITSLEGVVVSTGYWEVDQRLNPGNIGLVDKQTIEKQPVVNALQAIQGRVAGVQIQQTSGIPGSELNINIRGLNSLNNGQELQGLDQNLPNSNRPFYIIDGVPFPSSSLNANTIGGLDGGNPLAAIRPTDIESIEILKDADATAIYGSRGANGVVLITTKKGQAGKTKIDLEFSRGIGKVTNRVDLLNTEQYLTLRREGIENDGFPLSSADTAQLVDLFAWDQNRYTDWQEELLSGTASQTNAGVSISGGTAQTQYLLRGSFFRQTNVFNYDNSAFESGSGHFNLNQTSNDKRFNFNLSTTYTITNNDQNAIGLTREAIQLAPNAPTLFDENGEINFADNFDNPLAFIEQEYNNKTKNLITNLALSYVLLPGLTLKTTLGYNDLNTSELSIRPLSSLAPEDRDSGGLSVFAEAGEESWIIEPQIQYTQELGNGRLNVLVGASVQNSNREGITLQGSQYESDVLIRNLQAAPILTVTRNEFSEYHYAAVYARFNYTWNDKYIFNLTGRRDGSSRFGPDKQFGNFGAIGAAWIVSKESFVNDNLPFLSFAKIRTSYGLTGNDQIGNYGYLSSYSSSNGGQQFAYAGSTALTLTRAANPEFSWETNKKLEIGLELGLLQDRITINTSWFRNRSSDQLIGQPLSTVTGFNTTQFNLPALVENRGIEVEISSINLNRGDFQWTSSVNFTRYRNELVEFPNIEDFSPFNNRYVVGESTFGGKQLRVIGVNPETGTYEFVDFNNDGIVSLDDRQDYVEAAQDYFGGINNSFQWKGLQLDVFFQFVKQNVHDFVLVNASPGASINQPIGAFARWQNPGDVTVIPRSSRIGTLNGLTISNTNSTLVDASYLRLQNVSFSWQLPEDWISRVSLSQARVYVNGQNLLTITDYEGLDPETRGLSLPPLRMITTGIQLTF